MEGCSRIVLFLILAVAAVAGVAVIFSEEAEGSTYDVELNFKDTSHIRIAQGLNPIPFNYTVKHTGDYMTEEIVIELQNEPPYWQHYLSASTKAGARSSVGFLEILLQRNEVSNVTLIITPPPNQLNQTYWMMLNVYPKKEPTPNNRSHNIGVIIPQAAGFEIKIWNEPPEGYFAAIPPSQITLRFAIFNTGNGLDRFLVQYESSRNHAGWVLTPVSGLDIFGFTTNLIADPGKKYPYFIDFQIPIPADEMADVGCQVVVNATSMFNQSKQVPPAFTTIKALQYYDFQVYINGLDRKEGTPGEQVEFQLRIWNKGNGRDEFTIVPVWDEQLNPGFIASANPRTIDIASNATALVSIIVNVPETAPKKVCFISIEVSSSSNELAIVTKSVEVTVGQSYRIGLSSPQTQLTTLPGGVLDFEVDMLNEGNGLDSIALSLLDVPSGWVQYVQPLETSLLQGERMRVTVRLIVPSSYESAPPGSYSFTFCAASMRGDARATLLLTVTIDEVHRIEWMDEDRPITDPGQPVAIKGVLGPGPSINPFDGGHVEIALQLRNYGNCDDEVTIWVTASVARVNGTVEPSSVHIPSNESITVTVRIEVPTSVSPDTYMLTVNAESSDKALAPRVVPLEFTVIDVNARMPPAPSCTNPSEGPPSITGLYAREGSPLTFNLAVANAGTASLPACIVRCYDVYLEGGRSLRWNFLNLTVPPIAVGGTYVLSTTASNGTSMPVTWSARKPGPHTLEFIVLCDYQSDTTDDTSRVNVTVDWNTPTVVGGSHVRLSLPIVLVAMVVLILVLGTGLEGRRRSRAQGGERGDR
jgi:uncharacterized membrane protein